MSTPAGGVVNDPMNYLMRGCLGVVGDGLPRLIVVFVAMVMVSFTLLEREGLNSVCWRGSLSDLVFQERQQFCVKIVKIRKCIDFLVNLGRKK